MPEFFLARDDPQQALEEQSAGGKAGTRVAGQVCVLGLGKMLPWGGHSGLKLSSDSWAACQHHQIRMLNT